jgi:hypothetical protein
MFSQEGLGVRGQWAAFAVAVIAIFSRQPDLLLHAQFFAEDGWVWYQQAYNLHWLPSLGMAQAGYLQTLPRLVAGLTLLFPMNLAPLIMSIAGTVIQVLPVNVLLSRRCSPWGSLPVRMLMAAFYLGIPNAPEIHVVLTNAMWHFALLQAIVALSLPPLTWRGRVCDLLLFAVGSLTGPFCLLLLPVVALYWWIRRQQWTLAVMAVLSLGAILQILVMVHAVRGVGTPLGVSAMRLLRILAGSIFIDSMLGSGGPNLQARLLVAAAIAGLAIVVYGWKSATPPLRLYSIFAALVLAAALHDPLLLPSSNPRWETLARAMGIRYWFFPSLMFLWLTIACAFAGKARVMRVAGIAVLLISLAGIVRKWSYPPWPQSHFAADVERFKRLKSGERMSFAVYDPGGRTMDLIKH